MQKTFNRTLLALMAIGFSTLAVPVDPVVAAPVAQQKTQVPGYYRMMLGDTEVTALYDGYVELGANLLKGMEAKDIQALMNRMFLDSKGVQTAVTAYLINTGDRLILVDAGAAKCFGPTVGKIQDNLRAAGYNPAQVDTVLLTHLHGDHACDLTNDGKATFPNATVYVSKAEADYWLSPAVTAKAPDEAKPFFKMSQDAVAPYKAAKKLKIYSPGDTLAPGLQAVPTYGHTPGHISYLLDAGKQRLLIWGDIVHSHSVQFAHPEVAMEFDVDTKQAVATRQKVFADAAKNKLWIAGAHLPFPGFGHVRAEDKGYTWVPAEYSPIMK